MHGTHDQTGQLHAAHTPSGATPPEVDDGWSEQVSNARRRNARRKLEEETRAEASRAGASGGAASAADSQGLTHRSMDRSVRAVHDAAGNRNITPRGSQDPTSGRHVSARPSVGVAPDIQLAPSSRPSSTPVRSFSSFTLAPLASGASNLPNAIAPANAPTSFLVNGQAQGGNTLKDGLVAVLAFFSWPWGFVKAAFQALIHRGLGFCLWLRARILPLLASDNLVERTLGSMLIISLLAMSYFGCKILMGWMGSDTNAPLPAGCVAGNPGMKWPNDCYQKAGPFPTYG